MTDDGMLLGRVVRVRGAAGRFAALFLLLLGCSRPVLAATPGQDKRPEARAGAVEPDALNTAGRLGIRQYALLRDGDGGDHGETPEAEAEERKGHRPKRLYLRYVKGEDTGEIPNRWFWLLGATNAHPKMESERLISTLFNPIMRVFAPTFSDVNTVSDLRDDFLLWVPQFGFGRVLSEHWTTTVLGGFAKGTIRTKATDPSIFGTPLHSDFSIERGALFVGVALDYYPLGMPKRRKFNGILDRLRAAKPKLGTQVTLTYATFEAKVKVQLENLPPLSVRVTDSWMLPNLNGNIGLDIPWSKRNVLAINAGYTNFWEQERDFEGPGYTITWHHFFK